MITKQCSSAEDNAEPKVFTFETQIFTTYSLRNETRRASCSIVLPIHILYFDIHIDNVQKVESSYVFWFYTKQMILK